MEIAIAAIALIAVVMFVGYTLLRIADKDPLPLMLIGAILCIGLMIYLVCKVV